MSDQSKPAEIEDVLSSIRRLVAGGEPLERRARSSRRPDAPPQGSGEHAAAGEAPDDRISDDGAAQAPPDAPGSPPPAESDALVLTPALRVGGVEGHAAEGADPEAPDARGGTGEASGASGREPAAEAAAEETPDGAADHAAPDLADGGAKAAEHAEEEPSDPAPEEPTGLAYFPPGTDEAGPKADEPGPRAAEDAGGPPRKSPFLSESLRARTAGPAADDEPRQGFSFGMTRPEDPDPVRHVPLSEVNRISDEVASELDKRAADASYRSRPRGPIISPAFAGGGGATADSAEPVPADEAAPEDGAARPADQERDAGPTQRADVAQDADGAHDGDVTHEGDLPHDAAATHAGDLTHDGDEAHDGDQTHDGHQTHDADWLYRAHEAGATQEAPSLFGRQAASEGGRVEADARADDAPASATEALATDEPSMDEAVGDAAGFEAQAQDVPAQPAVPESAADREAFVPGDVLQPAPAHSEDDADRPAEVEGRPTRSDQDPRSGRESVNAEQGPETSPAKPPHAGAAWAKAGDLAANTESSERRARNEALGAPDTSERKDPSESVARETAPTARDHDGREAGEPADEQARLLNLFDDPTLRIDEEALRALIADVVNRELQGALGERVSRNIRRLVQREIVRALEARDLD